MDVYSVQVGMYPNIDTAKNKKKFLKGRGFDAHLKKSKSGIRVVIGSYEYKESAEHYADILRALGNKTAMVIKIKG